MSNAITYDELYQELLATRARLQQADAELEEAKDTLTAIHSGQVDAIIVNGADGHQLYALKTADETYRIFVEQMNEGAVTLNEDACIMYSNSRFAQLVDLPLEKIFGQSFYNFIQDDQREQIKIKLLDAWHSDSKTECTLKTHADDAAQVSLSMKVLHLDEGPALSIIVTDLTLQKNTQAALEQKNRELEQAQDALHQLNLSLEETVLKRTKDLEATIRDKDKIELDLRQNQQQLSDILETMAEGVCIVDKDGNLEYGNVMAHKLLPLAGAEKPINLYRNALWQNTTVSGAALLTEEHPLYMSMAAAKTIFDCEIGIQKEGTELLFISINATPVYNDAGKISGSIGTLTDVTNRRKAAQQKDDFINVASHELKTPITTLNGYLQLLAAANAKPPGNTQYLVEKASQSMARVTKLVHELLDNSRISGGQLSIRKTEFILADVVAESVQYIQAHGANNVELSGDIATAVQGDPDRIGQVVSNFLGNAFKYAPGSSKILVTIQRQATQVKLTVTDAGPGIEPEKIPHLFDKYYRINNEGKQYSGLGLGLYICSEIINRHGGAIGAESTVGTGSSFWFTLPV